MPSFPRSAARFALAPLLAAWAFSPCAAVAGEASTGQTVYRSLRAEGHDRLDELKLPRYRAVANHWAWQVATKHFVVVATTSAADAEWTAQQMEQAWADLSGLADHWTQVHRQATFGVGAVNVWVVHHPPDRFNRPGPGPRKLNDSADVFLNLGEGTGPLTARTAWLRREAVRSFLRVAQQDQTLPDWVQTGLAHYVAGEPLPENRPNSLPLPRLTLREPRGTWADRLDATRIRAEDPTSEESAQGILWTRYLLEGNDAANAPALMRAMAASVARQSRDPFLPGENISQVSRSGFSAKSDADAALAELAGDVAARGGLSKWLADPAVGRPIVRPLPGGPPLDAQGRRMAVLLKLVERFRVATPDLNALHRRLTDPNGPAWATLDADGGLLFSDDRAGVDELFRPADCVYRFVRLDDRDALEARTASGRTYRAWIEPNPKNPSRPIVYVSQR